MKENNILQSDEGMYRLFTTGSEEMYLGVLCGGIGMYEVKVKLTEDERHFFWRDKLCFLDDLADRIRSDPEKYRDRWVT